MSDKENLSHPALFLDRDGVINIDHGYVYKKEDFEFSKGIFDLVKLFTSKGYLIFVVTNQSGIGRGYYSEKDFLILNQWMLNKFKQKGIHIEQVLYCPHKPNTNCKCRKPNTALIEEILENHNIDLSKSYLIGDKQSDIDLTVNAGIKYSIYIGNEKINNCTLQFKTILNCQKYFKNEKIWGDSHK